MGNYLDQPDEDKFPTQGKTDMGISWGACEMQGWRNDQEDAYIIEQLDLKDDQKGMLFGVFDGHGGSEVSKFAKEQFKEMLTNLDEFKNGEYASAFEKALMDIDNFIKDKVSERQDSGSTAVLVLVTPDEIICSNTGDSRAALKSGQVAIGLSIDQKPTDPIERARIENANHCVAQDRVDGSLAVARALGDFSFKDAHLAQQNMAVSVFPEITSTTRSENDFFILVACDGIWDCLTNQQAMSKLSIKIATQNLENETGLSKPVVDMFSEIMAYDTRENGGIGTDNMTAILIYFTENIKQYRQQEGENFFDKFTETWETAQAMVMDPVNKVPQLEKIKN